MNEHEIKTIAAFIAPQKRERWSCLLGNPRRRRAFLDGLNHLRDLDPRRAQPIRSGTDLVQLLREHGSPEMVYLISAVDELDGQTLPLSEAIGLIEYHCWGTIVSCIPGQLAYYYDENGQFRMLLQSKH